MKYFFQLLLLLACADCAAQPGSRKGFTENRLGDKNIAGISVAVKECPLSFSCQRTSPPKRLFNFTGRKEIMNNHLFWKTTDAANTKNFELQHAPDTTHFTAINQINEVNLQSRQEFEYLDQYPCACKNYYRIKTEDTEGEIAYSEIILLDNSTKALTVYPVPARDAIKINFYSPVKNKNIFTIYDMVGKQLLQAEITLQQGDNSVPFSISNLPKGMYWVKVLSADGLNNATTRFVKE